MVCRGSEYVYLGHNRLRGPVPSELGNLSGLTELRLDHNRLTGSIPKELATPIFLQILALNDNRLSGAIPEELGKRTVNNSTSSHWNVWTESFWTYHHGLKRTAPPQQSVKRVHTGSNPFPVLDQSARR